MQSLKMLAADHKWSADYRLGSTALIVSNQAVFFICVHPYNGLSNIFQIYIQSKDYAIRQHLIDRTYLRITNMQTSLSHVSRARTKGSVEGAEMEALTIAPVTQLILIAHKSRLEHCSAQDAVSR